MIFSYRTLSIIAALSLLLVWTVYFKLIYKTEKGAKNAPSQHTKSISYKSFSNKQGTDIVWPQRISARSRPGLKSVYRDSEESTHSKTSDRTMQPEATSDESPMVSFTDCEDQFDIETRDPKWARQEEERIKNIFMNGSSNKLLSRVACHTTLCRIEFNISSPNSIIEMAKLPFLSPATTRLKKEGNERKIISYIFREGSGES